MWSLMAVICQDCFHYNNEKSEIIVADYFTHNTDFCVQMVQVTEL